MKYAHPHSLLIIKKLIINIVIPSRSSMIDIDGSYGEGGGQIVRSALSMAATLGESIRITNIRANRPNPGLSAQHITAIMATAKICNAVHSELKVGQQILEFNPGKIRPGNFEFNIGTAGSITLVFQTCILPAIFHKPVVEFTFQVTGGTDVKWSPPIDYFTSVFIELLKRFGIQTVVNLIRRGYYPKGGGEVQLKVKSGGEYNPIDLMERGKPQLISGVVHSRHLPGHITQRMVESAKMKLSNYSPSGSIDITKDITGPSYSAGTGIVMCANFKHTVLGASMLGTKGLPAEEVGTLAAEKLSEELNGSGSVDVYAADQLIPYLGLLGGALCVRELTMHTKTNIWLVEKMLNKKFKIEEYQNGFRISI
jgi:RNA 3'-phosphate cyclase